MCGICGFVGPGGLARLHPMVETLVHRGPDEDGEWASGRAALGMRRLAIIDLETGGQPIFNEDDTIAVVFNGEIYNFVELRDELKALGHRFRTDHSDTEVIVHAYEEYGDDFLCKLNGMFAIAIWDDRRGRLLLARDRLGIKPLYYAPLPGGRIVFGSEPKALLAHSEIGREPNPAALHAYFCLKNVPAPLSAFRAIRQLRAGERLVLENGTTNIDLWWRLPSGEDMSICKDEARHEIRRLLEDSVRLQMRSDVPVGAYLSGGVDSSSVVALMSQLGAQNIKTFTLVYDDGFAHKQADQEFARKVSAMYGTEHHEHLVRFSDVPGRLMEIMNSFDEPFSGVISTFFLTESIARHVKVALSGDGADELFGSYLPHRLAGPLAVAAQNPELLDSPDPVDAFCEFDGDRERLRRILARGDYAAGRMEQYLADDISIMGLYTAQMLDALGGYRVEGSIRSVLSGFSGTNALNRILYLDGLTLLPDQILPFVDRLSMAHSVEVRPPFLDHRLVEYVSRLPGEMKIKGRRVKSILKDSVSDLLPDGLVDRPKEGFVMPINDWLLTRLAPFVREALSASSLGRHGFLAPDSVSNLLHRFENGEHALASRLWNLVCFQMWWDAYQT